MITIEMVNALQKLPYPVEWETFSQVVKDYGGGGSPQSMRIAINCWCRRKKIKFAVKVLDRGRVIDLDDPRKCNSDD